MSDDAVPHINEAVDEIFLDIPNRSRPLLQAEKYVKDFYKSCLNYQADEVDADTGTSTGYINSLQFLVNVARSVGGMQLSAATPFQADVGWSLEANLAKATDYSRESTTPLFRMSVSPDMFNASINSIYISRPIRQLLLVWYTSCWYGDMSYYGPSVSNETVQSYVKRYLRFLQGLAEILGQVGSLFSSSDDDTSLRDLSDFELGLAKITPRVNSSAFAYELGSDDVANVSISDLSRICPAINWNLFFQLIGQRYEVAALKNAQSLASIKFTLTGVSYFKKLSTYLSNGCYLSSPKGRMTLQNYFALQAMSPFFKKLSSPIPQLYGIFWIGSTDEVNMTRTARKAFCLDETKKYFGGAVSYNFVNKYLSSASKRVIDEITEGIRQGFILKTLPKATWLDQMTRLFLEKKARELIFSNGGPDEILNATLLEKQFADFGPLSSTDYLKNLARAINGSSKNNMKLLDKPPLRIDWVGNLPINQNSINHQSGNVVLFPVANAMEPLFRWDFPKSFIWGSIGAASLAHEFSHAFDPTGMHFGDRGQVIGYWSNNPGVRATYAYRLQCLVDQYSAFEPVPGYYINGENTRNENYADNGVLGIAYDAFLAQMGDSIRKVELPGLTLTNEQVFLLGLGLSYCTKQIDDSIISRIATGVHSTSKERLLGMAMNSPEFSKAFNCPLGSPMNPAKRCPIW